MNKAETDGVIAYLNEAWPQRPISAITAGIWGSELAKFSHVRVVAVLHQLTRTEKFRPALAVILAELQPPAVGETASEAFTKVWAAIGRVGIRGVPDVSPRAARAIKHLGGWVTICTTWQQGTVHFHRRDFTAEFDQLEGVEAAREKHDRVIALTAGDRKNVKPLQSSSRPVSIGEAMKR